MATESAAPAEAFRGMDAAASEEPESDDDDDRSLDELETSLLGYEDDLLAAGVPLPEPVRQTRSDLGLSEGTPAATNGGPSDPERCERICELTASICDLSTRICALADDRPDQPRYTKACERATLDCEQAQRACEDCSE